MAGGVERSDTTGSVTDGELDSLLRTEERLQAAVAESEAAAARIRTDAEQAAESARSVFERELADERRAVEDRVTADRDAEIDRTRREHQAQKAALEGISEQQIEELATAVIRRLFRDRSAALEPPGPPA